MLLEFSNLKCSVYINISLYSVPFHAKPGEVYYLLNCVDTVENPKVKVQQLIVYAVLLN